MASDSDYKLEFTVPFGTSANATIAQTTMSVDKQPARSQTRQELLVDGSSLKIRLTSSSARNLRVAATSILDHVILVQNTIEKFGK